MESAAAPYLFVDPEEFARLREETPIEKVGEIEAVREETLPPLKDYDAQLGLKRTSNDSMRHRAYKAIFAELREKAAALNPNGGLIVITETASGDTDEVYRRQDKAEVWAFK